jgi:light-regulated signal transduction histidine kinase (bacteriophytochrome)
MIAFAHASQRLFSRAVAKALDLFSRLCDVMAEVRENRRKLETELFRNRYHHSSKNDDDLPIAR